MIFFYIQLSNTWRWLYKTTIKVPGFINRKAEWSQAISSPRSGNTYIDLCAKNKHAESAYAFSALFCWLLWPTVTGSTSTVMSTRWHFNRTVTQRKILERILHHKHLFVIGARPKTDGSWHVFGSMGVPATWRRKKFRVLKIIQSRYLFFSRRSKGIRIGNSLNRE